MIFRKGRDKGYRKSVTIKLDYFFPSGTTKCCSFIELKISGFSINVLGSLLSQNRVSSFHINVKIFFTLIIFFSIIPTCINTVSNASPQRLYSFRELLAP